MKLAEDEMCGAHRRLVANPSFPLLTPERSPLPTSTPFPPSSLPRSTTYPSPRPPLPTSPPLSSALPPNLSPSRTELRTAPLRRRASTTIPSTRSTTTNSTTSTLSSDSPSPPPSPKTHPRRSPSSLPFTSPALPLSKAHSSSSPALEIWRMVSKNQGQRI